MLKFQKSSLLIAALLAFGLLAGKPVAARIFDPETFTLANGMQVVLITNHRAPVVRHMVWYKVGSADEAPGESGIAHFLEHLMFKGTRTLKPGEFSARVARNGGQENAFTSYDYTAYHQTIARDRLAMVMEMEADRMTNSVITAEQVDPERQVVLEERRSRTDNSPAAQLGEQVNAVLYLNYPYRRPIIGWEHEIRELDLDRILAFYKRHYAPNNAVLIVEGDVGMSELKALAEKTYGQVPAAKPIARLRTQEPPTRADLRVVLENERVRQPGWGRIYLAPGYMTGATEHAYALQILSEIIGGGASSRLNRRLVIDQGIALSAGSYYSPDDIGPSTFGFHASPKAGIPMVTVEAAVAAEIAQILGTGVTEAEVADARRRMADAAILARDSFGTAARIIGAALAIGRSVDDVEAWPERVDAVTAAAVNAAARHVFLNARSVTSELLAKPAG
ncbi:MAG: pitrilysin family protein [Proteobacteria bacterium]|nr:pitrilysin family protein [Pseudomonadota bacterium]